MGQLIDQRMNGSWEAFLASPADFVGADDVITNLAKERAWERDHRTHSLIFDNTSFRFLLITARDMGQVPLAGRLCDLCKAACTC